MGICGRYNDTHTHTHVVRFTPIAHTTKRRIRQHDTCTLHGPAWCSVADMTMMASVVAVVTCGYPDPPVRFRRTARLVQTDTAHTYACPSQHVNELYPMYYMHSYINIYKISHLNMHIFLSFIQHPHSTTTVFVWAPAAGASDAGRILH